MSVEITENHITVNGLILFSLNGFYKHELYIKSISKVAYPSLTKSELAQLIAALQAMHNKMGDI